MTENKLKLSGGRGDRESNWKGGRLAADEDQLIGGGEKQLSPSTVGGRLRLLRCAARLATELSGPLFFPGRRLGSPSG